MMVEVMCDWEPCGDCLHRPAVATPTTHPVVEGSLTAARLRLADAAEAWWMANEADHSREWATLLGALAALRTARGEG